MKTKTHKLDPDVAHILATQVTITGNLVKMPQLERKLYERVNKALTLLGGKWNRSKQGHVFDDDPTGIITAATADGEVVDEKKTYQFFPTPPNLAGFMADLLEIKARDRILEPSAGHGALMEAAVEHGALKSQIHYCEINPKCVAILKKKGFKQLLSADFLNLPCADGRFDKIIANPPFTGNQDVAHVNWMFKQLKPGGRLVSLMSPSWQAGTQRCQVEFREFLTKLGVTYGENGNIAEIPSGTFKDTAIRTVLLTIDKPVAEPNPDPSRQPAAPVSEPRNPKPNLQMALL